MIRYLFIILVLIGLWLVYVKDRLNALRTLKNDKILKVHTDVLEKVREHDNRSVSKVNHHLKHFFLSYGNTFDETIARRHVKRMKWNRNKCTNYLNRISMRLPNDVELEDEIKSSSQSILKTLEIAP